MFDMFRVRVLGQNVMFGSVRSSVLLLCDQTSLGTYSLIFANCSGFCDVRHVRSSILDQNVMFRNFDVRTFNVQSLCEFFSFRLSQVRFLISGQCESKINPQQVVLGTILGQFKVKIWNLTFLFNLDLLYWGHFILAVN